MTEKKVDPKFQRGFREKDAFVDQLSLRPDARVIFDVGANQGQTSLRYRELFPGAHIHAFEPNPQEFEVLERRYNDDAAISCAQMALGATSGKRQFFTYEASVINSLMPFVDGVVDFIPMATDLKTKIDVEGSTLDEYCASNDIDHIDILKMDTQGAELEILQGAKRMLGEGRISLIYSEHIFVPLYDGQAEFHEVVTALVQAGYSLFDFYTFVYATSGQLKWGDAIYLKDKG